MSGHKKKCKKSSNKAKSAPQIRFKKSEKKVPEDWNLKDLINRCHSINRSLQSGFGQSDQCQSINMKSIRDLGDDKKRCILFYRMSVWEAQFADEPKPKVKVAKVADEPKPKTQINQEKDAKTEVRAQTSRESYPEEEKKKDVPKVVKVGVDDDESDEMDESDGEGLNEWPWSCTSCTLFNAGEDEVCIRIDCDGKKVDAISIVMESPKKIAAPPKKRGWKKQSRKRNRSALESCPFSSHSTSMSFLEYAHSTSMNDEYVCTHLNLISRAESMSARRRSICHAHIRR